VCGSFSRVGSVGADARANRGVGGETSKKEKMALVAVAEPKLSFG